VPALDLYRPRAEWYSHNPYGIHGLSHAARVLVWADQLVRRLEESTVAVDGEAVRWAAALHDIGRLDDGRDRQHGERSAAWLERNYRLLPVALDARRLSAIAYICRWHVPRDGEAPAMTVELQCLKDADGLDRVRIFDLDARQLRLAAAQDLVDGAWALCYDCYPIDRADPWAQVRAAAQERGLWR